MTIHVLNLERVPSILPEILNQLPPETSAGIGTLITIFQAVGVFFLIYLIFLIVNIVLNIRRGIMIKKTYNKVYEIDEKLDKIIALYEEMLLVSTSQWLYEIWEKYEVEYLVWDKKIDPEWQLEQYSFLEEIAVFGDIAIYQFSPGDKITNNQ